MGKAVWQSNLQCRNTTGASLLRYDGSFFTVERPNGSAPPTNVLYARHRLTFIYLLSGTFIFRQHL
jgi:hypothetical protein